MVCNQDNPTGYSPTWPPWGLPLPRARSSIKFLPQISAGAVVSLHQGSRGTGALTPGAAKQLPRTRPPEGQEAVPDRPCKRLCLFRYPPETEFCTIRTTGKEHSKSQTLRTQTFKIKSQQCKNQTQNVNFQRFPNMS